MDREGYLIEAGACLERLRSTKLRPSDKATFECISHFFCVSFTPFTSFLDVATFRPHSPSSLRGFLSVTTLLSFALP